MLVFYVIVLLGDFMDLYKYEKKLYKQGFNFIAGIDEVGRGPLIGSVVACCVVLPKGFKTRRVN